MNSITIKQVHKSFGKTAVLNGIDLDFSKPGIYSVLGPNGSGKTTLMKSILGMVIPNKGTIEVNETNIKNNWRYRKEIGYMPQIAKFPENLTVTELFSMIKDLDENSGDETPYIEMFDLQNHMNKKLGNLSGGTKQKVNVALAFMNNKPIVILDEPITGLDPIAMIQVKKIFQEEKQKGKTIIVTTHIMNLVEEISDFVVFLLEGKIYFSGTVAELKNKYNETNIENAIAKIFEGNKAVN